MNLATQIPGARLTPLHQAFKQVNDKYTSSRIPVTPQLRSCLKAWLHQHLRESYSRPFMRNFTHVGSSNASDTGLGYILWPNPHPRINKKWSKHLYHDQPKTILVMFHI